MEKILGQKREDARLRKCKSRRKLAKYEIKKILKNHERAGSTIT